MAAEAALISRQLTATQTADIKAITIFSGHSETDITLAATQLAAPAQAPDLPASEAETATTIATTNAPTTTIPSTSATAAVAATIATTPHAPGHALQQQQQQQQPPSQPNLELDRMIECPVCVFQVSESSTPVLSSCRHRVCLECMQRYIKTEINHSRLNITCPVCQEPLQPRTIKSILQNEKFYLKYETFMLRRVLAAEPDARWCPAPDCGYAVLATGCANCPQLVCGRESCNTSFCYHCKQEWHPNLTCNAASIQRNQRLNGEDPINNADDNGQQTSSSSAGNKATATSSKSSKSANQQQQHQISISIRPDDIKECPVCGSRIIKLNDGSCNHMKCSICETEFCWLCMKEISDFHYFGPSGCTFWGKRPWSRKRKLLWKLGLLVAAPICIILIAGVAVPAIVIGIPVWAARKLHAELERKSLSRYRKNAILTGGVLLAFVVSPIISAVALAIGVPMMLVYVYGVVPLSLCL